MESREDDRVAEAARRWIQELFTLGQPKGEGTTASLLDLTTIGDHDCLQGSVTPVPLRVLDLLYDVHSFDHSITKSRQNLTSYELIGSGGWW